MQIAGRALNFPSQALLSLAGQIMCKSNTNNPDYKKTWTCQKANALCSLTHSRFTQYQIEINPIRSHTALAIRRCEDHAAPKGGRK